MITSDTSAIAQRDSVFYHISSSPEEPRKVVMALKQASIMAEYKDELVYYIKGIEVVIIDAQI